MNEKHRECLVLLEQLMEEKAEQQIEQWNKWNKAVPFVKALIKESYIEQDIMSGLEVILNLERG